MKIDQVFVDLYEAYKSDDLMKAYSIILTGIREYANNPESDDTLLPIANKLLEAGEAQDYHLGVEAIKELEVYLK